MFCANNLRNATKNLCLHKIHRFRCFIVPMNFGTDIAFTDQDEVVKCSTPTRRRRELFRRSVGRQYPYSRSGIFRASFLTRWINQSIMETGLWPLIFGRQTYFWYFNQSLRLVVPRLPMTENWVRIFAYHRNRFDLIFSTITSRPVRMSVLY